MAAQGFPHAENVSVLMFTPHGSDNNVHVVWGDRLAAPSVGCALGAVLFSGKAFHVQSPRCSALPTSLPTPSSCLQSQIILDSPQGESVSS